MGTENENENVEETGIDDEALLAAVSDGIDEVSDAPENNDDGDDDESTTTDDTGTDESESESEGETDSDETDADNAGDKDDETDGDETDGDDNSDSDAEDGDGDEDGEDVGGKDSDTGDEKPDPINDPIPESTNEKTAERIQSLIGIAKESRGMAERGEEILAAIETTGADPQQYAATLAFVKLYNSDKPEDRAQALAAARGVVRELSLELGDGADSVINLADYDDLQAEVEAGTLTEARAVEIATQRERDKMQQSRNDATETKENQANETRTQIARGQEQLNNLETTLDSADPDYGELRPTFINMLKPVLRRTHPDEWGIAAQELYTQLKAAKPQIKPKPKPAPKNKPLRPKGDAGSSANKKAEPASAEEALDAALDGM